MPKINSDRRARKSKNDRQTNKKSCNACVLLNCLKTVLLTATAGSLKKFGKFRVKCAFLQFYPYLCAKAVFYAVFCVFGFHQCTQSPAYKTYFDLSKRDSLYYYVSRSHTGVRLLWVILLLHFAPLRGAVDAILQSSHLRGKLRARNPSTVSPFSFSVRIELSNLCKAVFYAVL